MPCAAWAPMLFRLPPCLAVTFWTNHRHGFFETETLTLVGVGSCKIPSPSAYVLAPGHFRLLPVEDATVELVGLVEDLPEPR